MSAKNSNKYSLDFFHSNPHNYGVIKYIRKKEKFKMQKNN